jgi:hypothetical protein
MKRMSYDPTAPLPYASLAVPTAPRRPTSVTVLAIIAIVVYSLLLLCMPLAIVPTDPEDALDEALAGSGAMRVYNIVSALIYMVICVLGIIAASYCLVLRPWARRVLVRVAIADLIMTAIGLVVLFAVTLPETWRVGMNDPSAKSMVVALTIIIIVMVLLLPVLPACIVFFMTRPKVVAAFDQARTTAERPRVVM